MTTDRAREVLRLTVNAHNAADEDNDITIWSDEREVVVAAMLAFAEEARVGERERCAAIADAEVADRREDQKCDPLDNFLRGQLNTAVCLATAIRKPLS